MIPVGLCLCLPLPLRLPLPTWLDVAHKKLDEAVAAAYGWPADLTDEQILDRLLRLNLERAAAETPTQPKRKAQREKAEMELL